MGDYSNAVNRLHNAVKILAVGPDAIKHRLRSAYLNQIALIAIDDLPDDLRPRLESLNSKLNKNVTTNSSQYPIDAALYRKRGSTLARIAEEIWDLYIIVVDRRVSTPE